MTHSRLPRLLMLAVSLHPLLRAEDKSVSVGIEGDQNKTVTYTTPTGADVTDHSLTINGTGVTADKAEMTSSITTSTSHDGIQWTAEPKSGLSHPYKITAAKSVTPLAVAIGGKLKDKDSVALPGGGLGGGQMKRSKDFTVKVPYAAEITTATVKSAQDGTTPGTRLTVGVGEEIHIKVERTHLGFPAITSSGGWINLEAGAKIANNSLPAGTDEFYFRAPGTAQDCSVTLTFSADGVITANGVSKATSNKAVTLVIPVIAPTGESISLYSYTSTLFSFTAGQPGVGMALEYTALPRTACFAEVEVRELGDETYGQPQNPTKFFQRLHAASPGALVHHPAKGWTQYGDRTSGTIHSDLDTAALKFGPEADPGKPYEGGSSFYWTIPVRWKCLGNAETALYTRTQTFDMLDNKPSLRVKKNDSTGKVVSVTRAP